jgi:hypothetical protein
MLDRRSNTLLLQTLDILRSHFTGKQRVLGEGLEIATAERVTMGTDGWSQAG